jgi:DNA-binding XRE family transcriptional regulator
MSDVYDSADLGREIRHLRKLRGWNQADLASWLGVSRPTVISLEHGGPVNLDIAMRALALLGAKAVIVPKVQQDEAAE